MRPDDREIERTFVRNLSPRSSYYRFFAPVRDLSPGMLDRFTQVDFPHEMALVATIQRDDVEVQIGVARYAPGGSPGSVEFAVVVADEWHGRGVGRTLLYQLFVVAKGAGLTRMEGAVLKVNDNMLRLCRQLGFTVSNDPDDVSVVRVEMAL